MTCISETRWVHQKRIHVISLAYVMHYVGPQTRRKRAHFEKKSRRGRRTFSAQHPAQWGGSLSDYLTSYLTNQRHSRLPIAADVEQSGEILRTGGLVGSARCRLSSSRSARLLGTIRQFCTIFRITYAIASSMHHLLATLAPNAQRFFRPDVRVAWRSLGPCRRYAATSVSLRAAVNPSPSKTHPYLPGSSDGAGSKQGQGISVQQRLSAAAEDSVASSPNTSFGFEISQRESATGGQAKSQGRPIYLDMQVRYVVLASYRKLISCICRPLHLLTLVY